MLFSELRLPSGRSRPESANMYVIMFRKSVHKKSPKKELSKLPVFLPLLFNPLSFPHPFP